MPLLVRRYDPRKSESFLGEANNEVVHVDQHADRHGRQRRRRRDGVLLCLGVHCGKPVQLLVGYAPVRDWVGHLELQPARRRSGRAIRGQLRNRRGQRRQLLRLPHRHRVGESGICADRGDLGCGDFRGDTGSTVPIPAGAASVLTGSGDNPLIIYQPSTSTEWEFWEAKYASGSWHACAGGKLNNLGTSSGVFPSPYGMSASGISYLGTLITEADVQSGSIDHTIAMDVNVDDCNGSVPPPTGPIAARILVTCQKARCCASRRHLPCHGA